MAKSTEMDDIKGALISILDNGCVVEIVMLSPNSPAECISTIADFLNINPDAVRRRINDSWLYLFSLRDSLTQKQRANFILCSHNKVVYASCFWIDEAGRHPRMLVDIKAYGIGRENSFSFETVDTSDEQDLYSRYARSFEKIRSSSNICRSIKDA